MKFRCFLFVGGLFVLGFLAGCHSTGPKFDPRADSSLKSLENLQDVAETNQIPQQWLQSPTNLFTLGPGDTLEIEILGEDPNRNTVLVGPDGRIYYHLLPGVDVWGLTLPEAKKKLEAELARFIREDPQVALTLRSVGSKRVWLLGRIPNPGVYPLDTPLTLLEAISMAGGTPTSGTGQEIADLDRSFVLRDGKFLPVDFRRLLREGDMSQNIYLKSDDLVYLRTQQAQEVYVLGAVANPTLVPYQEPTSLVAAIASAGGTIENAYLSHVAVVRGSLSDPKVAVVDYNDVVDGQVTDIRLRPGDIVYVPLSPYRILKRYAENILDVFVRTIAVNEGQNAVIRDSRPVGVNVPVGN